MTTIPRASAKRTSTIVDVRGIRLRDGRSMTINKVAFKIWVSSEGKQWVRARVNGHDIKDGFTDAEGFYVAWIPRDKLNVNKDEVNRFRFVCPDGKKVEVDLENEINIRNWKS